MRIITGSARGCRLKAPPGEATRPTADRTREALFSMLGSRVMDAQVLDLFAGTGALALEALSRGAAQHMMSSWRMPGGRSSRSVLSSAAAMSMDMLQSLHVQAAPLISFLPILRMRRAMRSACLGQWIPASCLPQPDFLFLSRGQERNAQSMWVRSHSYGSGVTARRASVFMNVGRLQYEAGGICRKL